MHDIDDEDSDGDFEGFGCGLDEMMMMVMTETRDVQSIFIHNNHPRIRLCTITNMHFLHSKVIRVHEDL